MSTTSPSQTAPLALLSEQILVGACLPSPETSSSHAPDIRELRTLNVELKELRTLITQIHFSEQTQEETQQKARSYHITTVRKSLENQLNSLIEDGQILEKLTSGISDTLLITLGDFNRSMEALEQVADLSREYRASAASLSPDSTSFKESAAQAEFSETSTALFLSAIQTAKTHALNVISRFEEENSQQIAILRTHKESIAATQSQLQVMDWSPGFFQIQTVAPQAPSVVERPALYSSEINRLPLSTQTVDEKPLLSKACLKALHTVRSEISNQIDRLKYETKTDQEKLHSENALLTSSFRGRFRTIFKDGLLQAIKNHHPRDLVPFFGTRAIRERASALQSKIEGTSRELEKLAEERPGKIRHVIRSYSAGLTFANGVEAPPEMLSAAVPLQKKDSLISRTTLQHRIYDLADEYHFVVVVQNWGAKGGTLTIENPAGPSLRIMDSGDGQARLYLSDGADWRRLGCVWNDDAVTITRRFLQKEELGVVSRGPKSGAWFIPEPSWIESLNH